MNEVVCRYLIDFHGERIQLRPRCVIWIGKKTGLQPVEPYTCVHHFLPSTGRIAAVVVSKDDYGAVMAYKSAMSTLKGMAFAVPAHPGYQIRFLHWAEVPEVADIGPSRMLLPMDDDVVCLIERLDQTHKERFTEQF